MYPDVVVLNIRRNQSLYLQRDHETSLLAPVFDSEEAPSLMHSHLWQFLNTILALRSASRPSQLFKLDLGSLAQPIHNCRRNIAFFVINAFHDDCIHILAIEFSQC